MNWVLQIDTKGVYTKIIFIHLLIGYDMMNRILLYFTSDGYHLIGK